MTNETKTIVLPVFNDREFTEQFNKHVIELAEKLNDTIDDWVTSFKDTDLDKRPSAYAIGAACYAALWKLSETAPETARDAMLVACSTTMLKNDTKFQLSIANLPPTPN